MAKRSVRDLDRPISILRATAAPGLFNEPLESWSVLAEVAADVTDASAGESYRAQQVGAEIGTRFRIIWSPEVADVNPCDRVVFEGRHYNITVVRDLGRHKWREIDAVARAEA